MHRRVIASAEDDRFEDARCGECGAYFRRYKAGRIARLCEACRQDAIIEEEKERRRLVVLRNEKYPVWELIEAPDMEWWGHKPCFTLSEIRASFGDDTKRYDAHAEYPFPPGCKFRHVRSGQIKCVVIRQGCYISLAEMEEMTK